MLAGAGFAHAKPAGFGVGSTLAISTQGVPSWSAIAIQPKPGPSRAENATGWTLYQTYPESSTGPSSTWSLVPSGNTGSYLTESSLTRGCERTRKSADTVITIALTSGPSGPSVGAVDAAGRAGEALGATAPDGTGSGDEELCDDPHPAVITTATIRTPKTRRLLAVCMLDFSLSRP